MYKDVKKRKTWKRVLSTVMCAALVITVIQWPNAPAKAEDGVVSHLYTYAPEGSSTEERVTTIEEKTAAAVFTIGKNETFGKEQLASISFDTHLAEGTTVFATTKIYVNPTTEDPTSGSTLCESTGTVALKEGTNTVSFTESYCEFERDTKIAVVVTILGDDCSFYVDAGTEEGKSYIMNADGSWNDAAPRGQCVSISMTTYDVPGENSASNENASNEIASNESPANESAVSETSATESAENSNSLAPLAQALEAEVTEESAANTEEVTEESAANGLSANALTSSAEDGIAAASDTEIDINSATVTLVSNAMKASNSSTEVYPEIEVTYGGNTLVSGTDYIIQTAYINSGSWNVTGSTATLVIKGQGNYVNTRPIEYTICNNITDVVTANTISARTYTGSEIQPAASYTITDTTAISESDLIIKYENNINVGTATIKIMPKTSTSYGGCVEQTFAINPVDISSDTDVTFTYDKKTVYTPAGITIPTVSVSYNGMTLVKDTDYTVSNSNFTSAGTGHITVNADAGTADPKNFTGTKVLDVEVSAYNLSNSNITITGIKSEYAYTGAAITPVPTLKYDDTVIYSETVGQNNFEVAYSGDTTNYGTVTITVTPTSTNTNYSGSKTISYDITQTPMSSEYVDVEYTGTNYTPGGRETGLSAYLSSNSSALLAVKKLSGDAVTLDDELVLKDTTTKTTLVKGTDYTLTYNYNKVVSTSEQLAMVTITGKGNYKGSMSLGFLIVQDIGEMTISIPSSVSYLGVGEEVTFADDEIVIQKDKYNTLTKDVDYSVDYENNTGVTTEAKLLIQGLGTLTAQGCYVGSAEKKFTISKKNIADDDVVAEIADITYDENKAPMTIEDVSSITVTYNGSPLKLGTDYEIDESSYTNNARPGTATVTITAPSNSDNFTGTKTVTFKILGKDISGYTVTDAPSQIYTGKALTPVITVTDDAGNELTKGTDYTVTYAKNGETVSSIVDAGTYDLIISAKDGSVYSGEITGHTFTVNQANISDTAYAKVATIANQTYTSFAITPTVSITNASGGKLVENTDYTLSSWSNNINVSTDSTVATATITGKGNYFGSTTVTFKIVAANISTTTFSAIDVQPYNETTPVTPSFTLTYATSAGEYSLKPDVDYTTEYLNNDKVGTATVKVTGKGNFTGTKSTTFQIKAALQDTCTAEISGAVDGVYTCDYTGTAIKPTVIVKNTTSGASLRANTDYTVSYDDNTNAGTAKITIAGKGSYTGQIELSFTINQVYMTSVAVTLDKTAYDYTGSQITPGIKSAKLGTYSLNSNDPYEVIYGENTNQGIGTVILSSTGNNITGQTEQVNFTINPKSIGSGTKFASGITMDAIETQDYTGTNITPEVSLHYKVNATTTIDLLPGIDFDVLYENNINAGIASITITAKGNYQGEVKQTFNIARNIVSDTTVITADAFDNGVEYTGKAITLDDLSVYLDGVDGAKLESANYAVTYANNTNAGEATVTISGNEKNYYTGSIVMTFDIYGNLAAESTKIEAIEDIPRDPLDVDGTEYTPGAFVITCGGVTLPTMGVTDDGSGAYDYEISYENNTKIGTATATLTATGTYLKGETSINYDIVPANDVFLFTYTDTENNKIPDQKYCGKGIEFDTDALPFVVRYVNEKDGVDRELVCGTDYELSYENNVNAGTATVTATGVGKYKHANQNSCTFTILPLQLDDLVIDDTEFLTETDTTEIGARAYTGKEVVPTEIKLLSMEGDEVLYTLAQGTDYTLTAVTSTGEGETAKTYPYVVGEKTAAVKITGSGDNCIGERTIEFDIKQKDIATTKISVSQMSFTSYPLTPEVVVTNPENDDKPLTYETDYYVEYENNTDAGEGIVRVVANEAGNYTGSAEATFKITPLNISKSDSIEVADIPDQEYNGAENKPSVNVVYTDVMGVPNTLVEGMDYTLSYAANTKAGTARVTITGCNNYTGTLTKTFTVTPKDIASAEITVEPIDNQAYTGSAITPSVTVKHDGTALKAGVDYSVTYTDNIQLGTGTATIYGKGNYNGSRTTTFKIASNISQARVASGIQSEYTYTGSAICPVPAGVSIGNTSLTAGKDYSVSYEENTNVGTGAVILTGLAEYGGTKRIEFAINAKDITDRDVTLEGYSAEAAYTESEVTLPIALKYGTMQLVEGTDFVVSYNNNFALGTASLEIVGIGNYAGTIEREFEVVKKSVADADVIVSGVSSTYVYNGEAIAPVPTVTYGEDTLMADYDYTVEYANNEAIGTATMTLTGIGKYQGTKVVTINILRKSVANCNVSSVGAQVYTGDDIEPSVTVSDGGKALTEGKDYTLMYSNNRKAGTGAVIIAGKGNYTVTKTVRFDIRPGAISSLVNTSTSNTSAGLSWTSGGAVTGYEIYRAGSDGKFARVARTKNTNYIDGNLSSGTAYTYRVRAYLVTEGNTYYSSFSDAVSIKTN